MPKKTEKVKVTDEDIKKLESMAGSKKIPPEIQELIDSGQLPEDIVKGLESGEITPEELLEYLKTAPEETGDIDVQQLIESGQLPEDIVAALKNGEISEEDLKAYLQSSKEAVPEELNEEINQTVRNMGIFEAEETDFRALLLFSLAFFAEQSLQLAEQAMKSRDEYQANHYAKRARVVRKLTEEIFGIHPQKDYYLGGFKEIKKLKGKIPHEEMMKMSEFVASNVQLEEALQANPKLLKEAFKKQLPSIKGFGLPTRYRAFLKEKFIKYIQQDRPDKQGIIYELLMLFNIAESVYTSIKEQKKGEKK